jgi:P-type Ca2+ transporter type 2C
MADINTKHFKTGLSIAQTKKNLQKFGYNEIPSKKDFTILKILLNQFNSFLVMILIAAGVISIALGEHIDGIAILIIVVINAIIGFSQEYKAENAVAKLKKLVVQTAIVLRNGEKRQIPIRELVPQDIIFLEEGDKVPADCEILEGFSLKIDESMLTGESLSVVKTSNGEDKEKLVFRGTIVTTGRAKALVLKTGLQTEFGKIIELLSKDSESKSPLALQLDSLGKKLGLVTLVLILILFLLGYIRGISAFDMLMTSVALGVSAIPEGLPIIVTLTLAMGVQTLARKKAIVRKMNSIETLGATTVICSDKTGTLTLNEMTVSTINTSFQESEIPGRGYQWKEKIKLNTANQKKLLEICQNCNNSDVTSKSILGDPTEIALKVLALKSPHQKTYARLDEKTFSSDRKMMSTYHKVGSKKLTYSKGAYEEILKRCSHILIAGKSRKITSADRKKIAKQALQYSEKALRVLACAYREGSFEEEKLIFVGLVGILDPPRPTVAQSIKIAQKAGIAIKIITGDNAITAKAIGEKIGLTVENIITGEEIDKLSDHKLLKVIHKTQIFARTKPEHKYRIVDLLQKDHEVVAVTGDGVNDAPALKHADVGVAMGIKGTEASKEVADIVLEDDNFSTIVHTIEEGRRIYHNILAFIKYMLSANFITIFVVGIITIMGYPLPILALQVLWLNVATDALPALALGRSPSQNGIMEKKPHRKNENIFKKFTYFIFSALIVQIIVNLSLYFYGLHLDALAQINSHDLSLASHARTLVFTQTVVFELFFAFVCKDEKIISVKKLLNNKLLIYAALISFALQLCVLYIPFMQEIFKTTPLSMTEWALVLLAASTAFLVPSIHKRIRITKLST